MLLVVVVVVVVVVVQERCDTMCPPELAWDNGGVSRLIQVSTFVSFSLERHKTLLITCCLFYHLFDQCENGDTVNMIFVETLGDVLIWIFCHFVICLFVSACSSPSHSGAGQTARMPVIKLLSLRLTEWRQKGGNRQRGHRGQFGDKGFEGLLGPRLFV